MAKLFAIRTPEQLVELEKYVKDDKKRVNDKLGCLAKVWSIEKRKSSRIPWEGSIYLAFESVGRGRRAQVYRLKAMDEKRVMAELKYTPALDWARANLEEIDAAL